MTQLETTEQNSGSGKAVAKHKDLLISGSSKFSSSFWLSRIYRPTYTRDGERHEIAEWFARIQYSGRREAVGLGTNAREEAGRKAARLYQLVRSKGWTIAIAEFRPESSNTPRNLVTVGDYLDLVKPLAKVRERTFGNYAYAFRKIALEAVGSKDTTKARFSPQTLVWRERANKVPLSKLTLQAVENWKSEFIAAAGKNPINAKRAKHNVNSFIGNAASLFSRRILKCLAELSITLPNPLPFQGVTLEKQGSTRYVSTINAAELMQAARNELAKDDPDAYAVVLLALGAGLRRSEIDGLCWTQVDFNKSEIRVLNHEHFEAKTEDSEGAVFVDVGLLAELKAMQSNSGLFVVQPAKASNPERSGQYYRCEEVFNRVTAWLRKNGVMADKPLHTLRKEFGSIICAQADIYTASRQLRHSDLATTAAFYTDHRRRATVAIGEMLKQSNTIPQ